MKTLLLLLTIVSVMFLQSCQQEEMSQSNPSPASSSAAPLNAKETNNMQKIFAKGLAKMMQTDSEVRYFIKQKALNQFNGDYDVLYQMVKDESINGKSSLHDRLIQTVGAKQLAEIEEKMPLLTIFIPTLPSGFSAETWDAQLQIPQIAVCLRNDNAIPYYNADDEEKFIEPGLIPGNPTLVIKQNERVTTQQPNTIASIQENLEFFQNDKRVFYFVDKVFDNIHPNQSNNVANRATTASNIDQINIGAFNINGANPNIQWQRDYVYYGISPTNTRGPLNRNYREIIRTMRFSADALGVMSDQSEDPRLTRQTGTLQANFWTDGRFEIRISVLINAKNGVGTEYKRLISVDPRSIYFVIYARTQLIYWKPTQVLPFELPTFSDLVPWDLDSYGSAWKFVFYEQDAIGTDTYTTTNGTTFGTNFEINASTGEKDKVGAKFGITTSANSSTTHQITKSLGDDFLGEAILTFDRPVISSYVIPTYQTYEISTGGPLGYVFASVEPVFY